MQRSDPARFVTVLFAPPAARETLFTLYAFNHELARAREVASIAPLALIRLQWWRDVVLGADRRHEVASPLRDAVQAGRLDGDALLGMIDGREAETEEAIDTPGWHAYLDATAGALMQQAGRVLGADGAAQAGLRRLGAGVGAAGTLRNAPANAARDGRWVLPEGLSHAEVAAAAAALLGRPVRWAPPWRAAALPAIAARRFLAGRTNPGAERLAVLAAAATGRC